MTDEERKNYIENILDKSILKKYLMLSQFIVSGTLVENKKILSDILSIPPILSISSYKHYLRYKAQNEWEIYRNKNEKYYNNLFQNITESLFHYGIDETIRKYNDVFDEIEKVTGKSKRKIINFVTNYYNGKRSCDPIMFSNASSNLKTTIKSFNSASKSNFETKYINDNLAKLKNCFAMNVNLNYENRKMDVNKFISIIVNNNEIRNTIKILILEKFNYTVDNRELSNIIANIINKDNEKNFEFFNIEESPRLSLIKSTSSFNRLNKNYLGKIKEKFDISQIDLINNYLSLDCFEEKIKQKKHFTNEQLSILEFIKPILIKANAILVVKNNDFEFESSSEVIDLDEKHELNLCKKKISDYNSLCKIILKLYYSQCKTLNELVEISSKKIDKSKIPFSDDNYILSDVSYLLNSSTMANILSAIDEEKFEKYTLENIELLRRLLINDGLLACVLFDDDADISFLADIINNLPSISINKNDINIGNLLEIVKKSKLADLIDNEVVSILGDEVAKKIAFDSQFLQGKNDKKEIKERLKIAMHLMSKAENVKESAVPYFEPISYKKVFMERYMNNDPKILISGIESHSCFKISGNDNDYLFYSILNKNGMVACIKDETGELIGRITAHRFSNCLLINSVRTKENDYQETSLTKRERNTDMVELIKVFGDKMIELTSDSDCPIDFVVSNKAGILESPTYDQRFEMIPDHLFRNPIDCYNEDFEEFRKEEYLHETKLYTSGSDAPFVTDFGNYPVVLISSRDNKTLERRWDITMNSPEAIYKRPDGKLIRELAK